MGGAKAPCESGIIDSNLWFSDNKTDWNQAKEFCQGCTLKRYQACQAEGWKHETGVWGGMSPIDRKRADPDRFAAAVSDLKRRSAEIDEVAKMLRPKLDEVVLPALRHEERRGGVRIGVVDGGDRQTGCNIVGCTRPHKTRGLCQLHYDRWRKGVEMTAPIRGATQARCLEEDCERLARSKGRCASHYQIWWKREKLRQGAA